MTKPIRKKEHKDDVWCDVHGCVHIKSKWPYDILQHDPSTQDENGDQVLMIEVDVDKHGKILPKGEWRRSKRIGTKICVAEPDCTPRDWKTLWIGNAVEV